MTAAQVCRASHPLSSAHSATPAASGQVVYVVCGYGGCLQRRQVWHEDWQGEVERRAREATVPASNEPSR